MCRGAQQLAAFFRFQSVRRVGATVGSISSIEPTQLPAASVHIAHSTADRRNPFQLLSPAGLHVHRLSPSTIVDSVSAMHGPSVSVASISLLLLFTQRPLLPLPASSCKVSSSTLFSSACKVPVHLTSSIVKEAAALPALPGPFSLLLFSHRLARQHLISCLLT